MSATKSSFDGLAGISSEGPRDTQQTEGLLLVGHGTRDEQGTRQFFELADILSQRLSSIAVQPCLLELQPPTIEEGWNKLVAKGVTHIHVAPLLLFAAGHAKQDIPDAVSAVSQSTPGVTYDFSRPLSRHPAIVDLVLERIIERLNDAPADEGCAVVMVGRGSHDPCARSDMFVLSEIVQHKLRQQFSRGNKIEVSTCFYAMAEPRLPQVLEEISHSYKTRHVVVYSHLLFEGRLYQAIQKQVAEVAGRKPDIEFRVCNYLGPNSMVGRAVAERALGRVNGV